MNKQQFNKTIETVINSPRSDLQKIGMLQNAFALYVKEETDRIVAELETLILKSDTLMSLGHNVATRTAIEIVRKGGVE